MKTLSQLGHTHMISSLGLKYSGESGMRRTHWLHSRRASAGAARTDAEEQRQITAAIAASLAAADGDSDTSFESARGDAEVTAALEPELEPDIGSLTEQFDQVNLNLQVGGNIGSVNVHYTSVTASTGCCGSATTATSARSPPSASARPSSLSASARPASSGSTGASASSSATSTLPGPGPSPPSPAPRPPAAAPAPKQPSSSAGFRHTLPVPFERSGLESAERCRCYAVWQVQGRPELQGVHFGPSAWPGIEERLPQSTYSYKTGSRLRRFDSLAAGVAGYLDEAGRHGAPVPPRLFRWPHVGAMVSVGVVVSEVPDAQCEH